MFASNCQMEAIGKAKNISGVLHCSYKATLVTRSYTVSMHMYKYEKSIFSYLR